MSVIVEWNAEKLKAEIAGRVAANMDLACRFAVAQAQSNAPVQTGFMKSEIDHVVHAQGDVVEGAIGVRKKSGGATKSAWYARFVELGTARMPAKPFLRPAVFGNAKEIVRIIQEGR